MAKVDKGITPAARTVSTETVCIRLPDGTWLAVRVLPDHAATGRTKREAEEAVRQQVALKDGQSTSGFFAPLSPALIARQQGVRPVRRLGQLRGFRNPDPKEAEWLARQVRRWRREGGVTARS
jgi:hypothetical protein